MYLTHGTIFLLVLKFVPKIEGKIALPDGGMIRILLFSIVVVLSFLLADVVYRCIERPAHRLAKKLGAAKSQPVEIIP